MNATAASDSPDASPASNASSETDHIMDTRPRAFGIARLFSASS